VTAADSGNFARSERAALCDLLADLGPDQPTLCAGWTTRDLAAHLILRERRPDAAAGIGIKSFANYTAKVQNAIAGRPFPDLVAQVRRPPAFSMGGIGPLDKLVNTQEFFIHHEDVRRAQPDWAPRPLRPALAATLWQQVKFGARFRLRKFPGPVAIVAPGLGELRRGEDGDPVVITGDPGELSLFFSGRPGAARVELTGPDDLVTRFRELRLDL
jgi:uncharacterized protein (TIGR03085 family)